jgi:multidrug efflux pump
MFFSRFFIDRPIFASVLSIVITLAGGIAGSQLPITQYPEITPPTVEVSAVYPGAHAQTVADTIAAPIEQQVNGVENMMYMSSQCTNDGTYIMTVTFKPGTDLNLAQMLVQNRVNLAQPVLPDLVKRRGVMVKKKSPSILMMVNLYSPDTGSKRDPVYLSNYATIQLRDELTRLTGVGDVSILGQRDYSMRVWTDPGQMATLGVTASDVIRAISEQNVEVAAGQVGQPPVPKGQVFQFSINALGRLSTPEQFAEMVIKFDSAAGRIVRMKDVAKTELGSLSYDQICTFNGHSTVAMSVYQLPGSNALETAGLVRAKMEELRARFPEGVEYKIIYDTTPFIIESVTEVRQTLIDAVLLVAIVMLVFLQSWRSAIIPLVAVPVAIVGTFAAMAVVGFSLNNLTLFGLVLAIGIVVDDAIVVVEAIEHHIEHGLAPREAAYRAMEQVSGPVIAVGLVLSAVFVPCTFIPGIVGQFFRQFAVTIAISTLISAFNSLTLSPALAAILLRPRSSGHVEALPRLGYVFAGGWLGYVLIKPWAQQGVDWTASQLPADALARLQGTLPWCVSGLGILGGVAAALLVRGVVDRTLVGFFRLFNRGFEAFTAGYLRVVAASLAASAPVLVLYGGLLYVTYELFIQTPTGYIPSQDKGYLVVNVQLPDSSSLEQSQKVIEAMEAMSAWVPGVQNTVTIAGQSLLLNANAPNFGSMYLMLDEFHQRAAQHQSAENLTRQLQAIFDDPRPYLEQEFAKPRRLENQLKGLSPAQREALLEELTTLIKNARVAVFGAPPVDGLGTVGGFKIVVEDRLSLGIKELETTGHKIAEEGNATPGLEGLFCSFRSDTPWLYLDIDRREAKSMGVSIKDVFDTLQADFGSLYVNDFNRFGRTWEVTIQAQQKFRDRVDGLKQLKVKNDKGGMTPLMAFSRVRESSGPMMVVRYNMYPAAMVNGNPAKGTSSGQAIQMMDEVSRANMAPSMRAEWTEIALLQQQAGDRAMFAFLLAVVLVFLVLAAQYESWALPLAVILVVPMCLLCAVAGVVIAKQDINIFTQIGFVVLVGLACKNAILIVEFAKQRREAGASRRDATMEACKLRLRPIMMTSFAFILGVVPLILAEGAGSEMRIMLGTAVFSGMLGVTLFGIVLTPVFFYVIQWFSDRRAARQAD